MSLYTLTVPRREGPGSTRALPRRMTEESYSRVIPRLTDWIGPLRSESTPKVEDIVKRLVDACFDLYDRHSGHG